MSDKPKIDWNIELDFDIPVTKAAPPPPPPKPKIPPRDVLKEKFPRILEKVTHLWGSMALHKYFQETLLTDRNNRQGFPPEVMDALGQLHVEHQQVLMKAGLIRMDVWDMQFRDVLLGNKSAK